MENALYAIPTKRANMIYVDITPKPGNDEYDNPTLCEELHEPLVINNVEDCPPLPLLVHIRIDKRWKQRRSLTIGKTEQGIKEFKDKHIVAGLAYAVLGWDSQVWYIGEYEERVREKSGA